MYVCVFNVLTAMDVCIFQKGGSAHEIFVENALTTTAGTLFSQMMDCLTLPNEASEIFSLWLTSPLLGKTIFHNIHPCFKCNYRNKKYCP